MRQINTKFLLLLVGGAAVATATLFGIHRLQAGSIAQALLWQADQAEKAGKPDQAARFLGRYLEFARDDVAERSRLGLLLADPKLAVTPRAISRARFVLEQVLVKDPQQHDVRQALVRLALLARRLDAAREHLVALEQARPESGEVALLSGQLHELQNEDDAAVAAYERAVKACPNKAEAYLRLAGLYRRLDFGKEASKRAYVTKLDQLVTAALAKAPDDAGVLSLAAQHAQMRGNLKAALGYLNDGLKRTPAEPRLYQALARLHAQSGKRDEALRMVRAGLKAVPKDKQFELTWTLANLLLDDDQMEEARKAIAEVRAVSPGNAEYLQARCLMQQGRWFEAAKRFEKLRPQVQPIKELAFQVDLYLGTCHEQLDEPTQQLAAFRRAAQIDPTSLPARRGVATALWSLGQTAEALAQYRTVLRDTTDRAEAARWRVEYARMLLQADAGHASRNLTRVEDEIRVARKDLPRGSADAELLNAEVLFARGERDKAEEVLRQATRTLPTRYEPWVALAGLALNDGKLDKAEELLRQARAKFPRDVEFRLAEVRFWTTGDRAEAALRDVEAALPGFEPQPRGRLLQALAEAHAVAGRHAEAARLLRQMAGLRHHAEDIRLRLELFNLAMLQKDDAEMQRVLGEIKEIETGGVTEEPANKDARSKPVVALTYWSFGEAQRLIWHARNGKTDGLERARQLLTAAAAQRPNWHAVQLARAEIDEMLGKTEQAIANYRLAMDLGSRDPQVLRRLVALLSKARRFEEADQEVRKLQKQLGHRPEWTRLAVAVSFQRKDMGRAEQLLRRAIAEDSKQFRDHLWLGQVLATRGEASPEAEKALRRAIELAPGEPEAWIGLIRFLAGAGRIDDALKEIANAEKMLPEDARDLALAQCCDHLGAQERARSHYFNALKQQPDSLVRLRAAADFSIRTGRPREAEPLYRRIVRRQVPAGAADLAHARHGLALALARSGSPKAQPEALQLVGLSLDEKGGIPETQLAATPADRLIQAKVLAALPSHRLRGRAIGILEGMQQKQLLSHADQFLLAQLLHQHASDAATWTKTRTLMQALTQAAPSSPRYLGYYANLLILNKEVPQAEPIVARLEEMERKYKVPAGAFGSIELKARCLEQRGRGAEAVALLKSFAAQKDAPPDRALLLAGLHGRLGNYKQAIDVCEQIRLKRGLTDAALGSAVALLRANRPAESMAGQVKEWKQQQARVEAQLRHAIAKEPQYLPNRLLLADLLELAGRLDEVEAVCRAVLDEDRNNLVALNNLAWLLAQQSSKAEEALTLVNRAIATYGERPELLDTRAVVYLSLGKGQESVADLRRVVSDAPTPARYFHLSQAHHQSKDRSSALAALQRANELGLTPAQLHPSEREVYRRVTAELRQK